MSKNSEIDILKIRMREYRNLQIQHTDLEKLFEVRLEEVKILRAKQHLDLLSLDIKIIPEFPDLVE